jgi:Caspase domain
MTPDHMSNDELFDLLRTLLNRQSAAPRVVIREFPSARSLDSRGFGPDDLAALRPYVISMRQGHWDKNGILNSTSGDVDAIFGEHTRSAIQALDPAKKLKIVIYAHGGLVSERNGLSQAQFHINWWKESAEGGIYPLYFIWKTGLGETIAQLLGLAGSASRELGRAWISDPVVAAIARRLGGESIWSGMKRDAEQAVLPDGVATYAARKLKEFCDSYPDRVELHAIGHSAGSIFHSHFIPLSTATGNPYFTTTSFLAPAVRVDTFMDLLTMQNPAGRRVIKPEAGHLVLFTMKKDFEQNDDCINIYHQSLLYLVYHAFEPATPTPILGLEECLRGDSQVAQLLGLGGAPTANAEVIWSKSAAVDGCSATQAIHHGDFSSDAPTFNSLIRRILSRCNGEAINPFPQARALTQMWDMWAPPDDLQGFSVPTESTIQPAPTAESLSAPAIQKLPQTTGTGKRKALCVGINSYAPPNRLAGCVHDANTWASFLQTNGFETRMLLDEDARYDAIMSGLRDLVGSSQSGDVIVFQYSGHGTTLPDLTGRTVDGIEEAMVPVDFSVQNPKLLMDFDMGAIFNTLPNGVNLTCFIDCCHSGTILRLFGRVAPESTPGADERARYIVLTEEEVAAVQSLNIAAAATARGNVLGGQQLMREVAFAACRPDEVAMEVNGQGDFTRFATGLLLRGFQHLSNEQFQKQVIQAFGPAPRQHPTLDCADVARTRPLLQPV